MWGSEEGGSPQTQELEHGLHALHDATEERSGSLTVYTADGVTAQTSAALSLGGRDNLSLSLLRSLLKP